MKRLPEQLFFPTGLAAQNNFFPVRGKSFFLKKHNDLGRFGDRFSVLFGQNLGCSFGQGLSSVCVDVCVSMCGCQTQSADGLPCWPGPTA